jgi:ABC-type glycerol-3-phosphate transport system permease component
VRRNKYSPAAGTAIFTALSLMSVTFVMPILFLFFNALKTRAAYRQAPFAFPTEVVWSNFTTMVSQFRIQNYMLNTLVICAVTIALMLLISIAPSYVFAKRQGPLLKPLYAVIVISMFMPAQVTLIPLYVMYAKMGLVNSPWSVALCYVSGGIPSCVMLLTAYFRGIPTEVCEASVIDGCSFLKTLWHIVLPMGKPAIAINVVFSFLANWNDLFTPLVLLNDRNSQTVMVALNALVTQYRSDPTFQMAGLTLVLVPVILVYLFTQRYLIEGISAGAIK